MQLSDRYSWESESANGHLTTTGGDISAAVRFSLIPAERSRLPRHDITGVKMVRRFGRGFIKTHFNSNELLPGLFYWRNGYQTVKTSMDVRSLIEPGDLVGKGVDGERWWMVDSVDKNSIRLKLPYIGNSKPRGMQAKKKAKTMQSREYVHCVVCEDFRLYVRCTDGTALVTPADYELYL